jgi:ClpP class serine protease
MRNTIASYIGAQAMAVDVGFGTGLLGMALPTAEQPVAAFSAGGVTIQRGERFAISRGIGVMPVRGMLTPNSEILERYLGWSTYVGIEDTAALLAASDEVAAVVLEFDSPGGLVIGMDAAVAAVAALAQVKPVYAMVNPLAASAAYHIASQCTSIAVTPGGVVGSIGVMRAGSWPVQPDMYGEEWSIDLSTHARAKWPNPTTEAGKREIARSLDESEARFHANVAAGRGIDPAALTAQLSVTDDPVDGGAIFYADDAIKRGLADSQETRAAFYDRVMSAHAPAPKGQARSAFAARAAASAALALT